MQVIFQYTESYLGWIRTWVLERRLILDLLSQTSHILQRRQVNLKEEHIKSWSIFTLFNTLEFDQVINK